MKNRKIICRLFLSTLFLQPFASSALGRDGFVLNLWQNFQTQQEFLAQTTRAQTLGATHFSIPALFCQESARSVEIQWCEQTGVRSSDGIQTLALELKRQGSTVTFLPLLIVRDGTWRGFLNPISFESWGRSYSQRLRELVEIASLVGVSEFIAGSEFNSLYRYSLYWRTLISNIKTRLPQTPVSIIANWDQFQNIDFWDATNFIGISGYYPLLDRSESILQSRPRLVSLLVERWHSRWEPRLTSFSRRVQKPLYFAEVGYTSSDTALSAPWDFSERSALNLEAQAAAFDAFRIVWARHPLVKRIVMWALSPSQNPLTDKGYDVFGKPAESVLSNLLNENRQRL